MSNYLITMNHLLQALSDPTRRKILDMLRKKDLTAGEIADAFDMTKPSISHHLDILRRANLVASEKEGQYITYSINTTELDELLKWIYKLTGQK
ncbi:MAG: autorepressor SdpR family transcription factor [Chitinophagales bacterium]